MDTGMLRTPIGYNEALLILTVSILSLAHRPLDVTIPGSLAPSSASRSASCCFHSRKNC